MRALALALSVSLLLLAPTVKAEDPPAAPALTAADLDGLVGDWWYGVYTEGKKIGWAHIVYAREGTTFASRMTMHFELVAMGERVVMDMDTEERYDAAPPFALQAITERGQQGADVEERKATRTPDGGLTVVTKNGADVHTQTIAPFTYGLEQDLASDLWIRRGPKKGEALAYTSFELDEGGATNQKGTVLEVEERLIDGVKARLFHVSLEDEREGPQGTIVADERGVPVSAEVGGMFTLKREPEEISKKLEASGDLFLSGVAAIDAPLGETSTLRSLKLRVEGKAAGELFSGPQQLVTKEAGPAGEVVYLELGPSAPRVEATADEVARASRASTDVPCDHPEVQRLAKEAVAGATTPAEKVEKLVHFVASYVEDAYGANALSVLDVIRRKRGDCTEHAQLFTALARAAGIPARDASGLMYMGDETKAFGGHAWNEVVLDGAWVPVDATFDQVRADPAHVRLGADGSKDAQSRVFGKIKFALVGKQ